MCNLSYFLPLKKLTLEKGLFSCVLTFFCWWWVRSYTVQNRAEQAPEIQMMCLKTMCLKYNTMSPGARQVTKMGEIVACTPHMEIGRPWWAFYLQNLTTNFSFLENPWGQLRPSRPSFAISEIIVYKAVPSTRRKYTIPKPSRGAKMHMKPEKSENKSRYHLWTGGLPQAWIIYKMIIPVLLTSPTDFLFLH